jgi:CBS domain-containing protein
MNIAFFLIPKNEVAFIKYESTMRQAIEKMEYHGYSAIPLIDREGKYICSLTNGDLLSKIKNTPNFNFESTSKIWLKDVPIHTNFQAVSINSEMEDIILKSLEQNFVPVIDDNNTFIGIITRKQIIEYCTRNILVTKKPFRMVT